MSWHGAGWPALCNFMSRSTSRRLSHAFRPASPHLCRARAIVATLGAEPQRGGIALASELYSPSLDTHQRVLILDALSSAALELAGRVPGRAGLGGGRGPGARARPPLPALGPDGGGKVGRVTWRADRSLQSLGSGGDSEGYTNR